MPYGDPDHEAELIEWERTLPEDNSYDYRVEAYGDRCPGCGTLRWGGDCPNCYDDEAE